MRKDDTIRRQLAVALVVTCFALSSFAQSTAAGRKSEVPGADAPALRLDAGDLVEITTFDTPELSGKFRGTAAATSHYRSVAACRCKD